MSRLTVWPDKFARGWHGNNEEGQPVDLHGNALVYHPVRSWREAFGETYSTDAHYVPYQIPGLDVCPRVNAGGLVELQRAGLDVVFDLITIDLDAPEHGTQLSRHEVEQWCAEQLAKVGGSPLGPTMGWYATRGGLRLVWLLPEGTSRVVYLRTLAKLRHALLSIGVEGVDRLIDWQRCYRLPYVVRDGVPQRLPMHVDDLGQLPPLADAPELSSLEADLEGVNTARASRFELPDRIPLGSQDQMLTAYAGSLRAQGMPPEVICDALALAYASRCEPPPPGHTGHTMQDFRRIARSVARYSPRPFDERRQGLDEVVIREGDFAELVRFGANALGKVDVFNHGGRLVQLVDVAMVGLQISPLAASTVREQLGKAAAWLKLRKAKKHEIEAGLDEWIEMPADPPKDVAEAVLARGAWPEVRELRGVTGTPVLRPDGTVHTEPGYDAESAWYLTTACPVPVNPTRAQAEAAMGRLRGLISEFPFKTPAHESVVLAALLTVVGRPAFEGPSPLFLLTATTPGSGKSLLADVVATIGSGNVAGTLAPTNDEETEKRISAIMRSGQQVVVFDNLTGQFGGGPIDKLLTSDVWTARVLGKSAMQSTPNRTTWLATGNNVQVRGDTARRVVQCYLEPETDAPEARTGFRHPNLIGHVREQRPTYVAAALTVLSAFIGSRDRVTLPPMGSYEAWSKLVRGALVWLGLPDPLTTQAEVKQHADARSTTLANLAGMWFGLWGRRPMRVRQVIEAARPTFGATGTTQQQETLDAMHDALVELASYNGGPPDPRRLGWALRQAKGRWFGRYRFKVDGQTHKSNKWVVERRD